MEAKPLNEGLFKALTLAFGEPRIINQGQAAEINYPPPIMMNLIGDEITPIYTNNIHGGEQYAVCCPFCGDKRYRLYFSYLWNAEVNLGHSRYRCSDSLVRCFNEECQRNPEHKQLIRSKLGEILQDKALLSKVDVSAIASSFNEESELANQVPLPPNLHDITDREVPDYVRRYWVNVRGYSTETLKAFGVKFAYLDYPLKAGAPICQQMITVIPVIQGGDYWFHQLRLIPINGDPSKGYEKDQLGNELPKYIIPHGSKKNWALYNKDAAQYHQTIYVVEGVTDVWRIGGCAVARFGKTLSRAQKSILKTEFAGKRLVLVPDMDDPQAYDEALLQQATLKDCEVFKDVQISKLEQGEDPGDLRGNPGEIQKCLLSNIILQDSLIQSQFGSQDILF